MSLTLTRQRGTDPTNRLNSSASALREKTLDNGTLKYSVLDPWLWLRMSDPCGHHLVAIDALATGQLILGSIDLYPCIDPKAAGLWTGFAPEPVFIFSIRRPLSIPWHRADDRC